MKHRNAPRSPALPPTLVVGGAGFIGAAVVEALLARGTEVRVLDDLSTGHTEALPLHDPNLELRTGDMRDADTIAGALDGMQQCVHLAAQPPSSGRDAWDAALANVEGFVSMLDAARRLRVKRVVYASSAAVYGEAPDRALAEDAGAQPRGPAGMEKLVAEGYAALYRRRYGVSTLGLRYFSVYGPGAPRNGVVARLLERLGRRRPALILGDGRQTRDFVHVDDAAAATVAALESTLCGVCNVATGERTELRGLVELLGFALDLRPLMHFAAPRPDDVHFSFGDTVRMREALGGIAMRPLRAGLAALASDFLAQERQRAARAARVEATPLPPPLLRFEHRHGRLLS